MTEERSFHFEEEKYEYQGMFDGYEVYVRYAKEGPDFKEAWALFEEARNNMMFRTLAGLGKEMEKE